MCLPLCTSTGNDWHVTSAERSEDRHAPGSRHQITLPAALWKRLGEVVGDGNRSLRIRQLVEADLAGRPAPPWPGVPSSDPTPLPLKLVRDAAPVPEKRGKRKAAAPPAVDFSAVEEPPGPAKWAGRPILPFKRP
jgi:hypothetical protein